MLIFSKMDVVQIPGFSFEHIVHVMLYNFFLKWQEFVSFFKHVLRTSLFLSMFIRIFFN